MADQGRPPRPNKQTSNLQEDLRVNPFGNGRGWILLGVALLALFLYVVHLLGIALALLIGLLCLYAGVDQFRKARRIADISTAKIRSASQGYVGLVGEATQTQTAPVSGLSCHYWTLYVETSRGSGWTRIATASSHPSFLPIADNTGVCYVIARGADVQGSSRITDMAQPSSLAPYMPLFPDLRHSSFGAATRIRLVEKLLPANSPIFATGMFRSIRSNASPFGFDWASHVLAPRSGAPAFVKNMAREEQETFAPVREKLEAQWFDEMRKLEGIGPDEPLTGSVLVHTLTTDHRELSRATLTLTSNGEHEHLKQTYAIAAVMAVLGCVGLLTAAGMTYDLLDPEGYQALMQKIP